MGSAVCRSRGSIKIPGEKSGKRSRGRITIKVHARINDIVCSYLEHRKQDVGALLRALADGEFELIQNVAHDLIGTGG